MSWPVVLVLTLLLLLVAVLSAASAAVRSVSHAWLLEWIEQRLRGAGAAEVYLERPHRLLHAAAVASSFALVLAGAAVAVVAGSSPGVLLLALAVTALLFLIFGQLVPTVVALHAPARHLPLVLPVLRVVETVFAPFVAGRRTRDSGGTAADRAKETQRDEIEELLREGELEGIGEPSERVVINGVLDFGARPVREVMRPRAEVFALDIRMPPRELARQVASSEYSRVPLYEGSLDAVIGMIHAFDVLKVAGERLPATRPVLFVTPEKRCSELLFEMLRNRVHLALVRDDAGHTVGLVTAEDLLEELVGDIHDEHDEPGAPRAA
ncbi:MAG TPA: CNNM domain-containing protein [Gemmatimonadaceae bacterium]|nr:CNNM domain-containing protein [Gemmatimonadaceae bacterium]